jgi:hypothetical protein
VSGRVGADAIAVDEYPLIAQPGAGGFTAASAAAIITAAVPYMSSLSRASRPTSVGRHLVIGSGTGPYAQCDDAAFCPNGTPAAGYCRIVMV